MHLENIGPVPQRCLHDLLEIEDELKAYMTNYRLNLYDCHEHDTFEEFKTGLRQVFEAVRYAEDKKKLKAVMEESREAYSRIDKNERYDMCKAFEDMRQEGYDEGMGIGMERGMERGIREGKAEGIIEMGIELGLAKDDILQRLQNKLSVSLQKAQEYFEMFGKQTV